MAGLSLRNIPQVTRILFFSGILLHLIGGISEYRPFIYLSADTKLDCFWTFVTSGFYEVDTITAVFNLSFVLVASKYFEHSWGSKEFIKFVVIVQSVSITLTYYTALFESYILEETEE